MAIISRFSVEEATSVRKVAKRTLTQRLHQSVGISDSTDSSESSDDEKSNSGPRTSAEDCKERSQGVSELRTNHFMLFVVMLSWTTPCFLIHLILCVSCFTDYYWFECFLECPE